MADLKYTRTNWKDYPDETTPVNAVNLNNIENGIEINATAIQTLNTKLSTKQDVLTAGNNGIVFAGSTISLNTNFIFETLLEYADNPGADINLGAWINPTAAESYRYFVVDLFIEPSNFSPVHLSSFWISADTVKRGEKTSMVYNLVGYDNLYMENVSVIFHDQIWLSLRNTPATSGTSSGPRYGSVYRIQGVR